MISPSKIAYDALGLPPPARTGHVNTGTAPIPCTLCGAPIAPGEELRAAPMSKATFTDWYALAAPSGVMCVSCAPFMTKHYLGKTQNAIFASNGAWKLTTTNNLTWLFSPLPDQPRPETPFVVVRSVGKTDHLIWRANVTLDPNFIVMQIGASTYTLDVALIHDARAIAARAVARAADLGVKVGTWTHPYRTLAFKPHEVPDHGVLRPDVRRAAEGDPELRGLLNELSILNEAELWALGILTRPNAIAEPTPLLIAPASSSAVDDDTESDDAA
jgi:CRISPR type IV-associated protein Csf1